MQEQNVNIYEEAYPDPAIGRRFLISLLHFHHHTGQMIYVVKGLLDETSN